MVKSLAALKRAMQPGTVFHVENKSAPDASGSRKVLQAGSKLFKWRSLDNRNYRDGWSQWPPAAMVSFVNGKAIFYTDADKKRIAFIYSFAAKASKRCRYDDCANQYPVARDDEPTTCPLCREYCGLPALTESERIANGLAEGVPPCAAAMGCLCAGHARGNPASAACDTSEG